MSDQPTRCPARGMMSLAGRDVAIHCDLKAGHGYEHHGTVMVEANWPEPPPHNASAFRSDEAQPKARTS